MDTVQYRMHFRAILTVAQTAVGLCLASLLWKPVSANALDLIDRSGKTVGKCECISASPLVRNRSVACLGYEQAAIVDSRGKRVSAIFAEIIPFSEELAPARPLGRERGLWDFIDLNGQTVISKVKGEFGNYDGVISQGFHGGLCRLWSDGHIRYIDRTGHTLISTNYASAGEFFENRAWFKEASLFGYMDQTGALVVPATFEDAKEFSDGAAAVKQKGKWGFIDTSGKWLIQPSFDGSANFKNGLAPVEIAKKWGAIDKSGKTVIPVRFDWLGHMDDELFYAHDGSRKLVIDSKGSTILDVTQYSNFGDFHEGLAAVAKLKPWFEGKANQFGYIDRDGKIVIPLKYRDARPYSSGVACVELFDPRFKVTPPRPLDVGGNQSWVGSVIEGIEAKCEFVSADTAVFTDKNGKKYSVRYSMEALGENDPGLDKFFLLIAQGKMRIAYTEQGQTRKSIWAICFSDSKPSKAYKLYRDEPPDPWGDYITPREPH
jgi:hypothetical protein